jgi:hypothetical protein
MSSMKGLENNKWRYTQFFRYFLRKSRNIPINTSSIAPADLDAVTIACLPPHCIHDLQTS